MLISVVEIYPVEFRTVQPAVASLSQVHCQIHMSPERAKPGGVEPSDGLDVAGHWTNCEVFMSSAHRFSNDMIDQQAPNPPASEPFGNDDGFDLPARPVIEQASKTHNRSCRLRDPGGHPFGDRQVVVESRSRIVASDQLVLVNPAVVLG